MVLPLLVAVLTGASAPPVPSDCQVDQAHDVGRKLHAALSVVDTHCAGERVTYLCSDQKCLKDPCGGYDGDAPSFVGVGSPTKAAHHRAGHRAKKGGRKASAAAETSGEVPALFTRGADHALQVVILSVHDGQPACRLVKGLDEVLVEATNKSVKIGETLGRSGERDAFHGQMLVLTRGLYAGGDEQGAPSHGYLRIHAKLVRGKLKFSGTSRITQDRALFGR